MSLTTTQSRSTRQRARYIVEPSRRIRSALEEVAVAESLGNIDLPLFARTGILTMYHHGVEVSSLTLKYYAKVLQDRGLTPTCQSGGLSLHMVGVMSRCMVAKACRSDIDNIGKAVCYVAGYRRTNPVDHLACFMGCQNGGYSRKAWQVCWFENCLITLVCIRPITKRRRPTSSSSYTR